MAANFLEFRALFAIKPINFKIKDWQKQNLLIRTLNIYRLQALKY